MRSPSEKKEAAAKKAAAKKAAAKKAAAKKAAAKKAAAKKAAAKKAAAKKAAAKKAAAKKAAAKKAAAKKNGNPRKARSQKSGPHKKKFARHVPPDKTKLPDSAAEILDRFEDKTDLRGLDFELRQRMEGDLLVIKIGHLSDRLFTILRQVEKGLELNEFAKRTTILPRSLDSWIGSPEATLFQKVLSSSLTVERQSFADDFFSRYINSVSGAETLITAGANHIVYGRRGSGKSSLLAYAMHKCVQAGQKFAWVSMQTYEHRPDVNVLPSVVRVILDQMGGADAQRDAMIPVLEECEQHLGITDNQVKQRLSPGLSRFFRKFTEIHGRFTVFLDDLHVLDPSLQPKLLSFIYAFARGNQVHIKVSAIQQFSRIWDAAQRIGFDVPHDAQAIFLDYNLENPQRSLEHITAILDAHAHYCGLPGLNAVASPEAISRLVWVAAGVPRDALYLLAQAMLKASSDRSKFVTVNNINMATSEAREDKLRQVEKDASARAKEALRTLEAIQKFCLTEKKTNAFLVEKAESSFYDDIEYLIGLRLLHVLNSGITPDRATRRWLALMLDYGFYVGIRAARNLDLFKKQATTPEVKELRKLPKLRPTK